MIRLAALALALLLAAIPASAELTGPSGRCSGLAAPLVAMGYQKLTVSSASVGLAAGSYATSAGVAVAAFASVETAAINARDDGTAPTTSVGLPFAAAETFWICRSSIAAVRFIAQAGDATLHVVFFRSP